MARRQAIATSHGILNAGIANFFDRSHTVKVVMR